MGVDIIKSSRNVQKHCSSGIFLNVTSSDIGSEDDEIVHAGSSWADPDCVCGRIGRDSINHLSLKYIMYSMILAKQDKRAIGRTDSPPGLGIRTTRESFQESGSTPCSRIKLYKERSCVSSSSGRLTIIE